MVAPRRASISFRSLARSAVLLAACAQLSTACGGDEKPSAGAAPSAPAPDEAVPAEDAPEPADAAAPQSGGRSARGAQPVTVTGEEPYESAELGALHGTILFSGKAPERFALGAATTSECKHHADVDQRSNVLIVNDGKLANAFVTLDSGWDAAKVPPVPSEAATLSQRGCMYVPRVLALRAGQLLRVSNDDPTSHNVHTKAKRNGEINKTMGNGQPPLEFRFEKPEKPVPFSCDVHPWMGAAVYAEEHPWFAVTDESGAFRIRDVPPGEYVVVAQHDALKKTSGKVKVEAGKSTGFTLTLTQ